VLFVINTVADNALLRLQLTVNSSFEALGDNATWPQYEEVFLAQKGVLLFDIASYWGLALIPSALLLILLRKTKPDVIHQDPATAPETP
jgi:hypothetical protein